MILNGKNRNMNQHFGYTLKRDVFKSCLIPHVPFEKDQAEGL